MNKCELFNDLLNDRTVSRYTPLWTDHRITAFEHNARGRNAKYFIVMREYFY